MTISPPFMLRSFALVYLVLVASTFASCQGLQSSDLGVEIKEFPGSQGASGFDNIPASAPRLALTVTQRPLTGPTPQASYEARKTVKAVAPDGTVYEGWCGRFDEGKILPGPGQSSSNQNARRRYPTHFGYGFNPADVFIGRPEAGKIRTQLFFRDVGSQETAPYHFAVDSTGLVHLIVSEVNIGDNNALTVYSLVGDPRSGKWTDATVLDRRGFTSWSRPWSGGLGDKVHLLWTWGDATYDKGNPNMGLFYVDRSGKQYGRKIRLVRGLIESYDAAIDSKSGQILVVATVDNKSFVTLRDANGNWRQPLELVPKPSAKYLREVSASALGDGSFVIRASAENGIEWIVRPQ